MAPSALSLALLVLLLPLSSCFTTVLPGAISTGANFALSFAPEDNNSRRPIELERTPNAPSLSAPNGVGAFFSKVKEIQKAFDDEVWDLFQGAKERKVRFCSHSRRAGNKQASRLTLLLLPKQWSPDRRPKSEQGVSAGPSLNSQLSWGGAESLEVYERMVGEIGDDKQSIADVPLGSAAVAMYGERGKLSAEDMEEELKAFRSFQAPVLGSNSRTIGSGVELAELVRAKYGKYHDIAVLRNTGQTAVNIYGPHLSQRSFPYTESQFLEKLDVVVAMLNDFDQAWYVKEFLLGPIIPRNGLPSTPRFDTAVTLRLNLSPTWKDVDEKLVEEWFSLPGFQSN